MGDGRNPVAWPAPGGLPTGRKERGRTRPEPGPEPFRPPQALIEGLRFHPPPTCPDSYELSKRTLISCRRPAPEHIAVAIPPLHTTGGRSEVGPVALALPGPGHPLDGHHAGRVEHLP